MRIPHRQRESTLFFMESKPMADLSDRQRADKLVKEKEEERVAVAETKRQESEALRKQQAELDDLDKLKNEELFAYCKKEYHGFKLAGKIDVGMDYAFQAPILNLTLDNSKYVFFSFAVNDRHVPFLAARFRNGTYNIHTLDKPK